MKHRRLASVALAAAGLSAFGLSQADAHSTFAGLSYTWSGTTVTVHATGKASEVAFAGVSWHLVNAPSTWPQTKVSESQVYIPAGATGDYRVTVPDDGGCGQRDLYASLGDYIQVPSYLAGPGSANHEPTLAQIVVPGNRNSYELDTSDCTRSTPSPTPTATPSTSPTTPTASPSSTSTGRPTPSPTTSSPASSPTSPAASSTTTSRASHSPSASSSPSTTRTATHSAPASTPTSTPRPTATLIPPIRLTRTPRSSEKPSTVVSVSVVPSPSRTAQVHGIPSGPADTGSGSSGRNVDLTFLGIGALMLAAGFAFAGRRHS